MARQVWVGGRKYGSVTAAAVALGCDKSQVCRAAKYGDMLKGREVSYVHRACVKEHPVPREFRCRTCGAPVVVDDPADKRTVFCSPVCGRRYWRHPERYER